MGGAHGFPILAVCALREGGAEALGLLWTLCKKHRSLSSSLGQMLDCLNGPVDGHLLNCKFDLEHVWGVDIYLLFSEIFIFHASQKQAQALGTVSSRLSQTPIDGFEA